MFKRILKRIFANNKTEQSSLTFQSQNLDSLEYLFDFRNYNSKMNGLTFNVTEGDTTPSQEKENIDSKLYSITPKQVVNEIENIPNKISLIGLVEKINLLKRKSKLLRDGYSKREVDGLIERLENRKQWDSSKEFFLEFPTTNDKKLEIFLEKYSHLRMDNTEIFIPDFPKEAIDVMEEYDKVVKKITNRKAVFYIIARDEDFKKSYKKRDPILLAQSPFSFVWYILGAWDEEMMLLSEL